MLQDEQAPSRVAVCVVTLFPEMFESFLTASLLGKATRAGTVSVSFVDPRDFTDDRHRSVDDTPYGGGAGMVLKPGPYVAAIDAARGRVGDAARTVLLSPQGDPLRQSRVATLAAVGRLVLVCGRYEGFDERIRDAIDEEISLGDYVLSGGEVGAMVLIDAVARLVPDVMGNADSAVEESFSQGLLEYPQYTRPAVFRGHPVPEILRSGDHGRIRDWRRAQALWRTKRRRPDLFAALELDERDRALMEAYAPAEERSGE